MFLFSKHGNKREVSLTTGFYLAGYRLFSYDPAPLNCWEVL